MKKHNKKNLDSLVKDLVFEVQLQPCNPNNLGLFSGLSGELLFLWEASLYKEKIVDEVIFTKKLEFLQENITEKTTDFSLGYGLAGTGWLLEYLNQTQKGSYDPQLCEVFDEILLAHVEIAEWHNEIEMVSGLAGLSVYFARRQKQTDQSLFYSHYVRHLENMSTQIDETMLSWKQPDYSFYKLDKTNSLHPEYNLGMAHGVVGIIASLIPALKISTLRKRVERLLVQSCNWLLNQQLKVPPSPSFYSSANIYNDKSRLGWCYGDLTIALTLARVGNALNIAEFVREARKISLKNAPRNEVCGAVKDAGICHGSAGLGIIYQLLHKEIGEDTLAKTSLHWFDYTRKLYDESGLKGLYKYSTLESSYDKCIGYLEGDAGVGLCLLGFLGMREMWVESLLVA